MEKIAEILTVTKQPTLQAHIMQKCGLTTALAKQYLTQLLEAGLLNAYPAINLKGVPGRKVNSRMVYQTSRKGSEFLRRYCELIVLIEATPMAKTLVEVEVCQKCGRELSTTSRAHRCPHCGGPLITKHVLKKA